MMNFSDLVQQRRACHSFEDGFKVDDASFLQILESVRFTPSGYNAQPWKFQLIRDEKLLQKIHEIAFKQPQVLEAGNLVVVRGDWEFGEHQWERILKEWKRYRDFDSQQLEALKASLRKDRPESQKREMVIRNCALAAMAFLLAAENEGFAACPMMGFSQKKLADILEMPSTEIPVLLIALGKASKDKDKEVPLPRKTAKEISILD